MIFMLTVVLLEEWRVEKRKIIYPLKINGQDDLDPTDEPNPAQMRVWAKESSS